PGPRLGPYSTEVKGARDPGTLPDRSPPRSAGREEAESDLTGTVERLGWTPLLLCDDSVAARHPHVLRVFSEVCWGLFELRRPEADSDWHQMLVYKMRNASLEQSKFEFRIGEGGICGAGDREVSRRPSFSRFRRARGKSEPEPTQAAPSPAASSPPSPPFRAPELAAPPGEGLGDSLDLLGDDDLLEMETAAARRPQPEASARARVLLVDDSPETEGEAATTLSVEGEVRRIGDGVEALRLLASLRPTLVVVGPSAGRVSGIGLVRILRDHGCDVPILCLTSDRKRAGERARCLMVGADEALPRAVEPERLRGLARQLLASRIASVWPRIDAAAALEALGPGRVEPGDLDAELARVVARAGEAEIAVSLLGYEFRFVSGEDVRSFVDHFSDGLSEHIRTEDLICRHSEKRIVSVLVDADQDGARAVVGRVHERMAAMADAFSGQVQVKPKALFRLLSVQPHLLDGETLPEQLVTRLFEQPARVIEEDLDDRPGEPMEKYPLLEAVFGALTDGAEACVSPLDGDRHAVRENAGVRSVPIGRFLYRTQDPGEESPDGFRASRGARIVWVEEESKPGQPVARIEEGRVFRGREA
ncbi:MAG: response regulator, partial [Myxococcota bacterium]